MGLEVLEAVISYPKAGDTRVKFSCHARISLTLPTLLPPRKEPIKCAKLNDECCSWSVQCSVLIAKAISLSRTSVWTEILIHNQSCSPNQER